MVDVIIVALVVTPWTFTLWENAADVTKIVVVMPL